ncbi:aldose epimerase family protein [Zunongwangia endophytica]|uniref:Aldose 1-epimerase n=1 Tax=Zunongwangia endophytica TaxID=1808945 RepID=A0ABV8H6P8_9FLAO|nr:aldose epimerase family protein [Zunongwangia endophytica]MDN3594446.1 aldose epimerase family protein [Zunongwangia endophytica]
MSIKTEKKIESYLPKNTNGLKLNLINYGGRITNLEVPDKNGNLGNVVLNLSEEDYFEPNPFIGALIGRYANRIANASFTLNEELFEIDKNEGRNCLHAGIGGFDAVFWTVEKLSDSKVLLTYDSPHLEMGFPGNLKVNVYYELTNTNELKIAYHSVSDQETVINLTQHAYFNLTADFNKKITDHEVFINVDAFLPTSGNISTGEIRAVKDSVFDFRKPKNTDSTIDDNNEQLQIAGGYDHCFVLNNKQGLSLAASAYDRKSGRFLEVFTTEPGVQFYTGNSLDGSLKIPNQSGNYEKCSGFCFKTQHFPDSSNQPDFSSVVIQAGEEFFSETVYKFSVKTEEDN